MTSKQLTPIEAAKQSLQKMEPEFSKILPSHIPPRKFVRTVQTAIQTSPKLLEANRKSLFGACMQAAEVGLLPNGKEAALVPFKGEVKFMSMVAGKFKLARNSGEIKSIDSQIVYENDEFEYYIDETGPHFKHKPYFKGSRGSMVSAYAIGITKDGGTYFEIMSMDDIKAVEKMSRGNNTPWKGPFRSEMIRKTVLNRLFKVLPTSTDLDFDTENDNSFYDVNTPQVQTEPQSQDADDDTPKDVTPKKEANPNKLEEMLGTEEAPPVSEDEIPI